MLSKGAHNSSHKNMKKLFHISAQNFVQFFHNDDIAAQEINYNKIDVSDSKITNC